MNEMHGKGEKRDGKDGRRNRGRIEIVEKGRGDTMLKKVWQWSVNQVERGKLNLKSDQLTLDGTEV